MKQIGRYQIVRELGRGAMGVVFEARDPLIGRTVALKMMRLDAFGKPSEREWLQERLFREARSAGALSHSGIVVIYDLGVSEDQAYIAMEYVEGPTLEQILATTPRMNWNEAVSVVRQVAEALDHAHGAGVVHRDVKPSNIMFQHGKTVKITDFGIAKIASTLQLTHTGMILGTPSYMSPEHISAQAVDGRTDQFALAVIAFELLAGQKPFKADALAALMYQIVHSERPSASSLRPDLPYAVDAVLKRGLSKEASDRYPSCSAFVDALEISLGPQALQAPFPRPLALPKDFVAQSPQSLPETQTASNHVPPLSTVDRPATRILFRIPVVRRPAIRATVAGLLAIAGLGTWVVFHGQRSRTIPIAETSTPAAVSLPPEPAVVPEQMPTALHPAAGSLATPSKAPAPRVSQRVKVETPAPPPSTKEPYNPLAWYQLRTDGLDARGTSNPMSLVNTSFRDSSLYLNGIYRYNAGDGYRAIASIPLLNYVHFTAALDFNAETFDGMADVILYGGTGYRWFGLKSTGGSLTLTLNQNKFFHSFERAKLSTGAWHNVICSVDLSEGVIRTVLDGRALEDVHLPQSFKLEVAGSKGDAADKVFTFADFSSGRVFKGYVNNLRIYDESLSAAQLQVLYRSIANQKPSVVPEQEPAALHPAANSPAPSNAPAPQVSRTVKVETQMPTPVVKKADAADDARARAAWYSKDYAQVRALAEGGNAVAQQILGGMYHGSYGVPKDDAQAVVWYRKAADQGDATAQGWLGLMYSNAWGVAQDFEQAAAWFRKAADQGDANGQVYMGGIYRSGSGVPKDDAQAAAWYRKAADQGNANAQIALGGMYQNGSGVAKDDTQAAAWYRRAADQGAPSAQNILGDMYRNGQGVPKDDAQAVAWFRKAADRGNASAQYNLGLIYYNGAGVPRDFAEGVAWLRKAADQGNAPAQYYLGHAYRSGQGVPRDDAQAASWYRKAADHGHPEAQFWLGSMYQNGWGVPKDDAQAVAWFRKAADQGNATGQDLLGLMYQNGWGVAKDFPQGAAWFRKAADQGYADAQLNLGTLYRNNIPGIPHDSAQAVVLIRKAADQGHFRAQFEMGSMYINGQEGLPKDVLEAVVWWRKAADRGYSPAQGELGLLYESGMGVPKDKEQAIDWYRKAAKQGWAAAKGALKRLNVDQ